MQDRREYRKEYRRRVVDQELDELFPALPAILLDGPKGVGKTATATQRAAVVRRLDRDQDRELLAADLDRIAHDPRPVLLDEWQRLPPIWDTVRRHVDSDSSGGQFLLTGSTPASLRNVTTHSGAGRITTLRVRPLTLPERLHLETTVSLKALTHGTAGRIAGATTVDLAEYASEIEAGGFPGMRHLFGKALRTQLNGYLDLIVNRDLPEAGLVARQPELVKGWLRAYAAATSTTTTREKIRRAATPGENPLAATTARPYMEILSALRILDPLPAWLPTKNHLRTLTNGPKHHLADPCLALRLLNSTADRMLDGNEPDTPLVRDGTFLGALFESLVAQTLRVFAQSAEANVSHLRTKGGRQEIDFIIENPNGIVAIETKLASTVNNTDVKHLHWLQQQNPDQTTDLAVITTGKEAYRRTDGIAVIPLALLGP